MSADDVTDEEIQDFKRLFPASRRLAAALEASRAEAAALRRQLEERGDVVTVPREELEILRDGFGLLRTAWNISGFDERINAQADALIERHHALRSGDAGKGVG